MRACLYKYGFKTKKGIAGRQFVVGNYWFYDIDYLPLNFFQVS